MTLYNRYTTPPPNPAAMLQPGITGKGWQFLVPETMYWIEAPDFLALVDRTREHYSANGFSHGTGLAAHVEEGIVRDLQERGIKGFAPPPSMTVAEFVGPLREPQGVQVGNDVRRIKDLL